MSAHLSDWHKRSGRHEHKYRIPIAQYYALRNAISGYMVYDKYTARAPRGGYFVRSLYYETLRDNVYREKMAGDYARVKYRIRTYSANRSEVGMVRAELKVRRGESLSKYQSSVPLASAERFIMSKEWGAQSVDPVLEEFARGVHLMGLNPVVLVDYHREGYESRHNDKLRVTFDHRVSSYRSSKLFPADPFFRIHHDNEVVMEVKYRQSPPRWLRPIVQSHGLRLVANSKFTQAIEVGCRDRVLANGVLLVR